MRRAAKRTELIIRKRDDAPRVCCHALFESGHGDCVGSNTLQRLRDNVAANEHILQASAALTRVFTSPCMKLHHVFHVI